MHDFFKDFITLGTQKLYTIELKNLTSSTVYEFEFVLDDEFFTLIESPEVKHGNINVLVKVVRIATSFELQFRLKGNVSVMCDRCLDEVEIPVETENRLIITFGEKYEEVGDEHVIVPESESAVDVAWFMYEFVILALPMRRVHKDGFCNAEMEKRLKELSASDKLTFNEEISDEDPRWETLKDLLNPN